MAKNDLINKRFTKLIVKSFIRIQKDSSGDSHSVFLCQCDCGNIIEVIRRNLIKNKVRSCGCLRAELFDKRAKTKFIGKKYGFLLIIDAHINGKATCLCDCGKTKIIGIKWLKNGRVKTCNNCINPIICGQKFGKLTVIENEISFLDSTRRKRRKCIVKCDCGNTKIVSSGALRRGTTISCGCAHATAGLLLRKAIEGERYGKVIITSRIGNEVTYNCDCGKVGKTLASAVLSRKVTFNCGCDTENLTTQTLMKLYNITNVSQIQEIKQKKIETCLRNNGTKYPAQNREIYLKGIRNCNKSYMKYNWENGEEILCKGAYEAGVIDYLNRNKISFEWQIEHKLKCGTYFCDLYLVAIDTYVEIKGRIFDDFRVKWNEFKELYPTAELWTLDILKSMNIQTRMKRPKLKKPKPDPIS